MTVHPKPSQVNTTLSGGAPFIGCFGKFEREIAAAIYVEACKARGDKWQPITPIDFGRTLEELGTPKLNPILTYAVAAKPPSWITFLQFGHVPDVPGLVKRGFLTMAEDQSVEPTDLFFETLVRKGYVSGS